jgi:hypothetical protein
MSTFSGVVAPSTRTGLVIQTRSGRRQYFIMSIRTQRAGCGAHCEARIFTTNTELSSASPSSCGRAATSAWVSKGEIVPSVGHFKRTRHEGRVPARLTCRPFPIRPRQCAIAHRAQKTCLLYVASLKHLKILIMPAGVDHVPRRSRSVQTVQSSGASLSPFTDKNSWALRSGDLKMNLPMSIFVSN